MNEPHPNLWHPYSQMRNLDYVPKAKATLGSKITLANNKILIDGTASWWTACHGYNHPKIIKAMKEQIDQMPHIMFGGLTHNPAEDLAKKITNILPTTFEHVFFVDSGSVAVEVSMKMAIQYWVNNKVYAKRKFLSFKNGYHGDTLGAMSVCDPSEGMHTLFKGYLPEQINTELPINKVKKEAFKSTLLDNKHEIAAIILEPLVQCAGGFKFHSIETLKFIDDLAKENNILIIADEIATGFGRTGSMFAFDQSKIIPDIICLGKALTGGTISLAAVVANSKIYDAFLSDNEEDALMHGPTYMANPLACSAANASIDLFRTEPRLEQVKNIEKVLKDKLKECKNMKSVIDVRVKGALGVIQVKKMHNLNWLRKKFVEDGVWIRPFLDVIYIMPSFTISNAEITKLTESIINIIPEWECKF
ncbi:MAG: adenosylmethionine--8-amino-7-oxononanoate transaminase [Pelagibacterales bacterium]|nr:adenosylmethionine--8-amino-7-oxononanoate transaminase [Pelagibacterales bacterium]